MKKLFGALAAGALVLAAFTPALAREDSHQLPNINVTYNKANITSATMAQSDTGNNQVLGNFVDTSSAPTYQSLDNHHNNRDPKTTTVLVQGDNNINTGDASATALSVNAANLSKGCGCTTDSRGINVTINKAHVDSTTVAQSETGLNAIGGNGYTGSGASNVTVQGNNNLTTGNATSKAASLNVVNAVWN